MAHRTDIKDQSMERPSEEDVQATAERTRAALEKLVNSKIKAAQPKNVPNSQGGGDTAGWEALVRHG
jgi:SNW domain-containing protein 1